MDVEAGRDCIRKKPASLLYHKNSPIVNRGLSLYLFCGISGKVEALGKSLCSTKALRDCFGYNPRVIHRLSTIVWIVSAHSKVIHRIFTETIRVILRCYMGLYRSLSTSYPQALIGVVLLFLGNDPM